MTTTPVNPHAKPPRQSHVAVAVLFALGSLAVGCATAHGATNQIPATTTTGYSVNHDSHHD